MSLWIPLHQWLARRGAESALPCPHCGREPADGYVIVRHEHARGAGHAPGWLICVVCRRHYAAGVATADDCAELRELPL